MRTDDTGAPSEPASSERAISFHRTQVERKEIVFDANSESRPSVLRRRVLPHSTIGWTKNCIVLDQQKLPDYVFTDLSVVDPNGWLVNEFFYKKNEAGPSIDRDASLNRSIIYDRHDVGNEENLGYARLVTKNWYFYELLRTIIRQGMIFAITEYSHLAFISSLPYHLPKSVLGYPKYAVIITWSAITILRFMAAAHSAHLEWHADMVSGPDIIREGNCLPTPAEQAQFRATRQPPLLINGKPTGMISRRLSSFDQWRTFIALVVFQVIGVTGIMRDFPTILHPWKGLQPYAAFKADGARMYILGFPNASLYRLEKRPRHEWRYFLTFVGNLILIVFKLFFRLIDPHWGTDVAFKWLVFIEMIPGAISVVISFIGGINLWQHKRHCRRWLERQLCSTDIRQQNVARKLSLKHFGRGFKAKAGAEPSGSECELPRLNMPMQSISEREQTSHSAPAPGEQKSHSPCIVRCAEVARELQLWQVSTNLADQLISKGVDPSQVDKVCWALRGVAMPYLSSEEQKRSPTFSNAKWSQTIVQDRRIPVEPQYPSPASTTKTNDTKIGRDVDLASGPVAPPSTHDNLLAVQKQSSKGRKISRSISDEQKLKHQFRSFLFCFPCSQKYAQPWRLVKASGRACALCADRPSDLWEYMWNTEDMINEVPFNTHGEDRPSWLRRRVLPHSTIGWTKNCVVLDQYKLPDYLLTDLGVVDREGGLVTHCFYKMSSTGRTIDRDASRNQSIIYHKRDVGSEDNVAYARLVTKNWYWNALLWTIVKHGMVFATTEYSHFTFTSTLLRSLDDDVPYLLRYPRHVITITWSVFVILRVMVATRTAHLEWLVDRETGPDIIREGHCLQKPEHSSFQEDRHLPLTWSDRKRGRVFVRRLRNLEQWRCFIALIIFHLIGVTGMIRDLPLMLHPWKGLQPYAAFKADGARMYLIGFPSASLYRIEKQPRHELRYLLTFVVTLLLTAFKVYVRWIDEGWSKSRFPQVRAFVEIFPSVISMVICAFGFTSLVRDKMVLRPWLESQLKSSSIQQQQVAQKLLKKHFGVKTVNARGTRVPFQDDSFEACMIQRCAELARELQLWRVSIVLCNPLKSKGVDPSEVEQVCEALRQIAMPHMSLDERKRSPTLRLDPAESGSSDRSSGTIFASASEPDEAAGIGILAR